MSQPSRTPVYTAHPPASAARSRGGCGRALLAALGVVVVLALVAAGYVFGVLPATGCVKAGTSAAIGAVSDYCYLPFTGNGHSIKGMTAGPDGNLWFTDGARVGRMTPAGTSTEFALPAGVTASGAIAAGSDGNLWFVERSANAIGRMTPQGVYTAFPLPAGPTSPVGITAGPDGALWYTRAPAAPHDAATPGLIGRMATDGTTTEYSLARLQLSATAQPRDIVAGLHGTLWFDTGTVGSTVGGGSWIGDITTTGAAAAVYTPAEKTLTSITSIASGPDGNIWFTQTSNGANISGGAVPQQTGTVGRLTTNDVVTLFPLPPSASIPGAITAGPEGNLWFAASAGVFGRATTSGELTFYPLPDSQALIGPISNGPGDAVWCAQTYPDTDLFDSTIWGTKIGRIVAK